MLGPKNSPGPSESSEDKDAYLSFSKDVLPLQPLPPASPLLPPGSPLFSSCLFLQIQWIILSLKESGGSEFSHHF